ncbi:hypothetical protein Tsubulata_024437 [Turnera subulata]|uniref:Mitochondrial glycoprotein n=1 Tax=Turnera subulata TaxID=218843 RepID=A0A9Q0FAE0_9ROSI|nr:hypothetical protein Tsubulata_024437 [Turnera subulata]
MARLIMQRTAKRSLLLPSSPPPPPQLHHFNPLPSLSRPHSTTPPPHQNTHSPLQSNILRILHKEVDYHHQYAPPHQPPTTIGSFTVQDRPGEQWMTMRSNHKNAREEIKLEVTMFDGCVAVPKYGEDSDAEDVRLHMTVLVDVIKEEGGDVLEFLCSAWADRIEIQKVYLLPRVKVPGMPYLGPDFRSLNREVQKRLEEYLEERGVNDELAFFLHEFMMNKDRVELIRWFEKIKNFVDEK